MTCKRYIPGQTGPRLGQEQPPDEGPINSPFGSLRLSSTGRYSHPRHDLRQGGVSLKSSPRTRSSPFQVPNFVRTLFFSSHLHHLAYRSIWGGRLVSSHETFPLAPYAVMNAPDSLPDDIHSISHASSRPYPRFPVYIPPATFQPCLLILPCAKRTHPLVHTLPLSPSSSFSYPLILCGHIAGSLALVSSLPHLFGARLPTAAGSPLRACRRERASRLVGRRFCGWWRSRMARRAVREAGGGSAGVGVEEAGRVGSRRSCVC